MVTVHATAAMGGMFGSGIGQRTGTVSHAMSLPRLDPLQHAQARLSTRSSGFNSGLHEQGDLMPQVHLGPASGDVGCPVTVGNGFQAARQRRCTKDSLDDVFRRCSSQHLAVVAGLSSLQRSVTHLCTCTYGSCHSCLTDIRCW